MSAVNVVIDAGTQNWRYGTADKTRPEGVIRPNIDYQNYTGVVIDGVVREFRPDHNAINCYKKHIKESFSLLNIPLNGSDILLGVPLKLSNRYRELLTEMIIEKLGADSVFYVSQPLLSVYSSDYASCIVVDSGYSNTEILAVRNLKPLQKSERVLPIGGREIDAYFRRLIPKAFADYGTADLETLKIYHCCLESSHAAAKSVIMPDGKILSLSAEALAAPELLFNPSQAGFSDVMPVDRATICSAMTLEEDESYAVFETVTLTGGTMQFPGISQRMSLGIATKAIPRINRRVKHHKRGTDCVWVGGSVLASTETYSKIKIKKEEYNEHGAKIALERWL